MTEIPIACTLSPAEMNGRREDIRALGRDAIVSVECGDRDATLRFRPGSEIRERVGALGAAESECCPFLDLALSVDEGGRTVVTVAAPQGGEATVRELVYLFSADARVNAAVCTCPSSLNSRNSR